VLDVVNLRQSVHAIPDESIAEPFGTLAGLRRDGLIRHLGLSGRDRRTRRGQPSSFGISPFTGGFSSSTGWSSAPAFRDGCPGRDSGRDGGATWLYAFSVTFRPLAT
jgi:hypothetical protein